MIECGEMTIKIGDRIVGRQTGTLTPSTVIGIMTHDFYMGSVGRNTNPARWFDLYPDWEEKNIIISMFDEPQYCLTFEELEISLNNNENSFINTLRKKVTLNREMEIAIIQAELDSMPKSLIVAYPIDDVDVI